MPECRSCGSEGLVPVLSLGHLPLADALVAPSLPESEEPKYPLDVSFCPSCTLVQILRAVPPEELFCRGFPYYSSFSDEISRHARRHCEHLIELRGLDRSSLVVEIGSNDGYLLRHLKARSVPVLGVDPAAGPARAAEQAGVPTRCVFFDLQLAGDLRAQGLRADVIIANNVLAHVPDPNELVAGMAVLLADDGVVTVEVPYVRDLIDRCEFDTIYHEHHCYFSATALDSLFARHGLTVFRVEHIPVHGGSLRLWARSGGERDQSVASFLQEERTCGLTGAAYYRDFADRVAKLRQALRSLLERLRARQARIGAYGAAAKGSILLNSCGIGRELVDFVVDRNTYKHGLLMPGVRIPIHPTDLLLAERPKYVLLLAWNFRDEILRQQAEYREGGGRFVVPIPVPEIV